MLMSAVFLILWNSSSWGVISTAELSTQNPPAVHFDLNRLALQPSFVWDKKTSKRLNFHRRTATAKPVEWWDRIVLKPGKPIKWERYKQAEPFDWPRFTSKPFDVNAMTAKPFGISAFTAKPFDGNRYIVKYIDWNKFRSSGANEYYYKRNTNSAMVTVAIILPIALLAALVLFMSSACRRRRCAPMFRSSTANPNAIFHLTSRTPMLHPPPSIIPPPPSYERGQQTYHCPASDISGRCTSTTDKPPDYDSVVGDALSAGHCQFTEAKSSIPESPPPKYDEGDLMRY